jgi:CRP-like cAMP-binding protein
MAVSVKELSGIPLFQGVTPEHMSQLVEAGEVLELSTGDVLFEAGSEATHLYLVLSGTIGLREGADNRYSLHAPAPIGELGVVAGIRRQTTATASEPSRVWRIARSALMQFFEEHGDVAFPIYHNLLNVVGEKVRRDRRRMDEMRENIIRTQKAMKRLRDLVLESEETSLSEEIHDTLEDLITRNRRWNYVVEPSRALPANVRLDNGRSVPVAELSAVWLTIPLSPGTASLIEGDDWSGVLVTPDFEIPLNGIVRSVGDGMVRIELGLLIDEFAERLEDFLTRVQMLDVVV